MNEKWIKMGGKCQKCNKRVVIDLRVRTEKWATNTLHRNRGMAQIEGLLDNRRGTAQRGRRCVVYNEGARAQGRRRRAESKERVGSAQWEGMMPTKCEDLCCRKLYLIRGGDVSQKEKKQSGDKPEPGGAGDGLCYWWRQFRIHQEKEAGKHDKTFKWLWGMGV